MDTLIADVLGDVALVLVVSWLAGMVARRCGQPTVVGQIVAGVLLGPSALGRLPGHLTSRLFPHAAIPSLTVLSQAAIVMFMFVAGYELDRRSMQRRCRPVILIAAVTLIVPIGLGSAAALLYRSGFAALGQSHISHSFVLFMGVAIGITALPVLVAITRERGIAGSASGVTATTAAGLMDAAAWLVLAAALTGTADKPGRPWPVTLLLVSGFAAIMLLAVRPALRRWMRRPGSVLANQLPVALALAFGSAWVTAALGLHPIFGGFLAGLTMPSADGTPEPEVLRPMEDISGILLPLFFVVTGLSTKIGALDGSALAVLLLLLAIASAGKLVPAYAAARVSGMLPRDAATVAALLNTRGLTELIALNVGLSAGLISERLFSMLVLMAILLTVATAPLLRFIDGPARPAGHPPTIRSRHSPHKSPV